MSEFEERISGTEGKGLVARDVEVIQVNVGLKCNQACLHCHLDCSPKRTEVMDWPVMERVVEVVGQTRPRMVDITGGAPDHIRKFDRTALAQRRIVTGMHCFGCTAGQGSSCAGAMVCSH